MVFVYTQRGKKAPEGLTPAEQVSDFQQIASHPGLHSASVPGILALDLSADSSRAITGIVCVTCIMKYLFVFLQLLFIFLHMLFVFQQLLFVFLLRLFVFL